MQIHQLLTIIVKVSTFRACIKIRSFLLWRISKCDIIFLRKSSLVVGWNWHDGKCLQICAGAQWRLSWTGELVNGTYARNPQCNACHFSIFGTSQRCVEEFEGEKHHSIGAELNLPEHFCVSRCCQICISLKEFTSSLKLRMKNRMKLVMRWKWFGFCVLQTHLVQRCATKRLMN